MMDNFCDSDKFLLQELQEGNEQSFISVFDRYHRLLYSQAYNYLNSAEEAEDAVQYTFMKLWERRLQLDFSTGVKSLLFAILKNYILNEIRHKKVVLNWYYQLAQEEACQENNIQLTLEKKDCKEQIYKAISQLPEQKRLICFLKIEKGLSNQEIAEKMQITLATVKSHYTQAIKMLRKELEGILTLFLQIPFF